MGRILDSKESKEGEGVEGDAKQSKEMRRKSVLAAKEVKEEGDRA
jgi:hypothetical protein